MAEKEEKIREPDKFTYKEAFEQKYMLQRLTDNFALNNPIRFAMVAYFSVFFGLFYLLFSPLLKGLPSGIPLGIYGLISYGLASVFCDLRPDGKSFAKFMWDYLVFYFTQGRKSGYFYQGQYVDKEAVDGE